MPGKQAKAVKDLKALSSTTPEGLEDVEADQARRASDHMTMLGIAGYLCTIGSYFGGALRTARVHVPARALLESLVCSIAPGQPQHRSEHYQSTMNNCAVRLSLANAAQRRARGHCCDGGRIQ